MAGDRVGFSRQRLPAGLIQSLKRVESHRDAREESGGRAGGGPGQAGLEQQAGPCPNRVRSGGAWSDPGVQPGRWGGGGHTSESQAWDSVCTCLRKAEKSTL